MVESIDLRNRPAPGQKILGQFAIPVLPFTLALALPFLQVLRSGHFCDPPPPISNRQNCGARAVAVPRLADELLEQRAIRQLTTKKTEDFLVEALYKRATSE